jgi:hypothetical protein
MLRKRRNDVVIISVHEVTTVDYSIAISARTKFDPDTHDYDFCGIRQ